MANLSMDEKGRITGTITLSFMGAAAVDWRHTALSGDEESLKNELHTYLQGMVPSSMDVKVDTIDNLQDYEQPLSVTFQVTGTIGTMAGKRLILPSDLLEARSSATFSDEKRVQAVYFDYPKLTQDALRVNLPQGFSVEAVPAAAKVNMLDKDAYSFTVTQDSAGFTARRDHAQGEIIVLPKDYETLQKYYSQFESKDHESVVLQTEAAAGN